MPSNPHQRRERKTESGSENEGGSKRKERASEKERSLSS